MRVEVKNGLLVWGDIVLGPADRPLVAHGEPLLPIGAVRATLAPVPGGDIVFATKSGVVGIERKRFDDLVSSHASGHLATQLGIMLDCYDHVVLAVEIDKTAFGWYDDAVLAQDMLTYQAEGIRVILAEGSDSLAQIIERLPAYYARGTHHALERGGPQDSSVYRRMLIAAPGWGPETAKAALSTLGPPIKVFTASTEQLVSVRGVTPRKVQQLFVALGRRFHEKVSRRVAWHTTHNWR